VASRRTRSSGEARSKAGASGWRALDALTDLQLRRRSPTARLRTAHATDTKIEAIRAQHQVGTSRPGARSARNIVFDRCAAPPRGQPPYRKTPAGIRTSSGARPGHRVDHRRRQQHDVRRLPRRQPPPDRADPIERERERVASNAGARRVSAARGAPPLMTRISIAASDPDSGSGRDYWCSLIGPPIAFQAEWPPFM
jgi:hypothetical protein